MAEAKRQAWLAHMWATVTGNGTIRPDGTWPGMPTTYASGHPYEPVPTGPGPQIHDTVVIDCEEFPCLEAGPTTSPGSSGTTCGRRPNTPKRSCPSGCRRTAQ